MISQLAYKRQTRVVNNCIMHDNENGESPAAQSKRENKSLKKTVDMTSLIWSSSPPPLLSKLMLS